MWSGREERGCARASVCLGQARQSGGSKKSWTRGLGFVHPHHTSRSTLDCNDQLSCVQRSIVLIATPPTLAAPTSLRCSVYVIEPHSTLCHSDSRDAARRESTLNATLLVVYTKEKRTNPYTRKVITILSLIKPHYASPSRRRLDHP